MNGLLFAFNYPNDLSMIVLEVLIAPTVAAALLTLFVLVINIFIRKWLTAGQMALLWSLVLFRLAMPIGPESDFSLQNMFNSSTQEVVPAIDSSEQWEPVVYYSSAVALPDPSKTAAIKPLLKPEMSVTETLFEYLALSFEYLPLIWLMGATLIAVRMLIIHLRFVRKVNRVSASTDDRLLQLWKSCCQQIHIRRSIPIIVFDEISQPSVLGAFRPKLLLPTDVTELDDNQLRLIMLHELAHITRRDLCVNWILFGLRLFHWWNPIYWLAATRFYNLREQSRDAMVLRWMESQNGSSHNDQYEYSELLLTLAQSPAVGSKWRMTLPVSILGFLSSPFRKRSLANRLKSLRSATVKYHPLHKIIVVVAIVLFAVSGLTDARQPPVEQHVSQHWLSPLTAEFQTDKKELRPLIVQSFDVTAPLKKIMEEEQITENQARQWILLTVKTQLGLLNSSHRYSNRPFTEDAQLAAHYGEKNQLIIRAPAVWQKELGIMFESWANSGFGQIALETRIAAVSTDITATAGIEWNTLEGYVAPESETKIESLPNSKEPIVQASAVVEEYFPIRIAVLTKEQQFQFIQKAQHDEFSNMTLGPKYTSFNGQKVMVGNLVYRPYVIGVEQQESEQLKAKYKMIEEGMSLKLRPILSADRSAVHLDGLVQLSQILDANFLTTKVAGKEATIQVPRVHRRRISVASNLKDQQCLLVCLPPTLKEKRFQYLMIKVQILDTTNSPQKESK